MQQHFDDYSLNSISYSMIRTEKYGAENSDDSCTCGRDDFAVGDGYFQQRYPTKKIANQHSKHESTNNYRTVTEHELLKPYPKLIADRFEAEYEYCIRWTPGHKLTAVKVIPFQSNFYSAVRLTFQGRNWALKCGNYKNQYDYCGWLPSPTASQKQLQGDAILHQRLTSLMTDSSELSPSQHRHTAGKITGPSDTAYDVQSLQTDYSDDSVLTKDPIDSDIYNIVGESAESVVKPMQSTVYANSPVCYTENESTYLHNHCDLGTNESISLTSIGHNEVDLNDVFHDLVELNQLLAQQVEEAKAQSQRLDEFVEHIGTAVSFSDASITTASDIFSVSGPVILTEESTDSVVHPPPNVFSQLACFAGRRISMAFFKNWIKK